MNRFSDHDTNDQDGPGSRVSQGTGAPAPTGSQRREIAVALGHDRSSADAPRVIASGKGAVARQILEIAFARGIKVREDSDLAEVLAAVEVDSEIPLAAFAAVAEILSYIYRAQDHAGQAARRDAATTPASSGPGSSPAGEAP